eukprot:CAMPEP_0181218154 /NCGR_PEP_ID=MMETSP1096-20121128/27538_1 /TAXON_ID=156174 ORGANISM="Chrysochromulina ericina, Strain CCMP281" /NCGR_SAMPLE_ID=MMETSP1096 /ASSEMBLY_ACC=CAM_ASM_000453 /LENGTH=147 /DNA_ID=CAMNT_0023310343 /DNA_START=350 /DNA_END=789 /DNA_ORIENTATION=+
MTINGPQTSTTDDDSASLAQQTLGAAAPSCGDDCMLGDSSACQPTVGDAPLCAKSPVCAKSPLGRAALQRAPLCNPWAENASRPISGSVRAAYDRRRYRWQVGIDRDTNHSPILQGGKNPGCSVGARLNMKRLQCALAGSAFARPTR